MCNDDPRRRERGETIRSMFGGSARALASSLCLTFVSALVPLTGASAQSYPTKPITIMSDFAAASNQGLVVQAVAEAMAKHLGQPVVVDPRPGAGALAPAAVATAQPDGHTIAAVATALAFRSMMQRTSYDPFKDFTYIMQGASFPIGVAVKADSPFKTWDDLVAYAKANPGAAAYGTPGVGSGAHLFMERIQRHAGITLKHVPFQGGLVAAQAVLDGRIMLQASGLEWKRHVDAGTMRLLAMWTKDRHPSFPNTPTLRELGYPFDFDAHLGFIGPKGMDPTVTAALHDALKKAFETPEVRAALKAQDISPDYANGVEFRRRLEEVAATMKPIVAELGLAPSN